MSLLGAVLNAAGASQDSTPPIPYTSGGLASRWAGGASRSAQLDLTTAETTLFSVLDLISGDTAAAPWHGQRPIAPGRAQDAEPVIVTPEQNLAVQLWARPNQWMTGRHIRKVLTWHYAAVGEAWAVVRYADAGHTIPLSWWPVGPDRMQPVPDPKKFITGYVYTAPNGEQVPLDVDQVLRMTNPHPKDPHRGCGVVQTLGTAAGLSLSSQEWIAAFFENDASPGGLIEVAEGLNDNQFTQLKQRWNEQHRGASRAHRVAILEYGKWVPRSSSLKDMQFPQLRTLSRDQVLEGFRVHRHMLGASDDVNRANAESAEITFDRKTVEPLLEAWKEFANEHYLDSFGAAGKVVELCYESPVQEDAAAERAETAAKVDNTVKLLGTGLFDTAGVVEAMGLPPLPLAPVEAAPEPDPVVVAAPAEQDTSLQDAAIAAQRLANVTQSGKFLTDLESRTWVQQMGGPIVAGDYTPPPEPASPVLAGPAPLPASEPAPVGATDPAPAATDIWAHTWTSTSPADDSTRRISTVANRIVAADSPAADVDLSQLDSDWQAAVTALLERWQADVLPAQYAELVEQVRDAVAAGDLDRLADLAASTNLAESQLTTAMAAMAVAGAGSVTREAAAQGVHAPAVAVDDSVLARYARVACAVLAATIAASAAKEAIRLAGPGAVGTAVAAAVRQHLEALSTVFPLEVLGAALTVAQNTGRNVTLAAGPAADFYASEVLDSNTCAPCRAINGRHLGDAITDGYQDYPTGGYVGCLGRDRCRGVVVAVWRRDEG